MLHDILDTAKKYDVSCINIGWLGEPTLHPDFSYLLGILEKYNFNDTFLHTNGVLFTEEKQKAVLDTGIKTVIFSLGQFNDSTRFNKTKTIIANIEAFSKTKKEAKTTFPLIIASIIPTDGNIEILGRITGRIIPKVNMVSIVPLTTNRIQTNNRFSKIKFECTFPFYRLSIDCRGDIYPCCAFSYYNKKLRLGNIQKDNLETIWKSITMNHLRKQAKNDECTDKCCECANSYYTANIS